MKLLVLGGTLFVGRHLVGVALERGHDVTTFTRGRTNPELFRAVEMLRGDRDGDLTSLRGQSWDAVVDTSGYLPRQVRATSRLLADVVETYCFISSASVYAAFPETGAVEDDATHAPAAASISSVDVETYGPLKVGCEREVRDEPLTMSTLLETCADVSGSGVRFVWAPDDFLLAHDVEPWADLPLWLPGDAVGPILDTRKARAAGLRCRSIDETVRDVLRDQAVVSPPASGPVRPGTMSRQRERELLRLLARRS